jgi:DNA-binding transcriptional LysR family regulator
LGQTFNNYVQAAQAVLEGRGVMLGWRSIASGAVRDGALRMWPGGEVDLGTSYFVTASTPHSKTAQIFLNWIMSKKIS